MTATKKAGPSFTEREFQDRVVELAHLFEWKVAHFGAGRSGKGWRTPVRYDGSGFPDLVLVHPERRLVLYREIKGSRTEVTKGQRAWGERLLRAGADWAIWRPADWPTVQAVLSGGRILSTERNP